MLYNLSSSEIHLDKWILDRKLTLILAVFSGTISLTNIYFKFLFVFYDGSMFDTITILTDTVRSFFSFAIIWRWSKDRHISTKQIPTIKNKYLFMAFLWLKFCFTKRFALHNVMHDIFSSDKQFVITSSTVTAFIGVDSRLLRFPTVNSKSDVQSQNFLS